MGRCQTGGNRFLEIFRGCGKLKSTIRVGPDLGTPLALRGGSWSIFFLDGHSLSGRVIGGTVRWPAQGSDIGCGNNVGVVRVDLRFGGTLAAFDGCLHDCPLELLFRRWFGVNFRLNRQRGPAFR